MHPHSMEHSFPDIHFNFKIKLKGISGSLVSMLLSVKRWSAKLA